MSAVDKEGDEVFYEEKLYMPVPERFARDGVMGRGPYEKSGIVADTGLPPNREVDEHFEILFPYEKGDKASSLDLTVQLWYLPYGSMEDDPFLWKEYTETLNMDMKF